MSDVALAHVHWAEDPKVMWLNSIGNSTNSHNLNVIMTGEGETTWMTKQLNTPGNVKPTDKVTRWVEQ